jgi:hypothetical protein
MRGRDVIAGSVLPPRVSGVRQFPVQFHDEAVLRVVAIPVAAIAVRLGELNLTPRCRQSVRALHVAVVPVLEHRVRSPCRRGDDLVERTSPAQALAAVHRRPQRPFGRKPSPEGGGHPPAGVVKFAGGVHEVENRLLDRRAREHPARKGRVAGAGRDMDHEVPGAPYAPAGRDRQVNQRCAPIGETVKFGGRLVA